jgi:hypothetical protein
MCKRTTNYGLWAFYIGVILLGGCFPEDSLEWSADGSVGLLRTGGKLYLVDGGSGALSPVAAEGVAPWPGIARDGGQITYAQEQKHATLAEGLKALPAGQVELIAQDAQKLREKILGGALALDDSDGLFGDKSGYAEPYRGWVVRSLCEKADEQLTKTLGAEVLQKGKESELLSYRLIVAPRSDPAKKQVLTTSALGIVRPRFSPDGKHVAYLLVGPAENEEAHLFVASRQGKEPMHVASNVALGFDWRPDSQAVAYLRQEDSAAMLGAISEQRVSDPNGRLLAEVSDKPESPLATCHGTGESKQFAGTLFDPLLKVEYGVGGRLFFSSPSAKIPSSDLDESKYSLFCYDTTTGAVADVLPSSAANSVGQTVNFFSLSPDGRRVLLPMQKNRFAVYELSAKSATMPIGESEQFDDDAKVLPAWKGNDRISCQVSEKSHFVTGRTAEHPGRREIVVLNAAGDFQTLLSNNWPDPALPGASDANDSGAATTR